jgi:D-3-phosphoglycerate dehydrogenase / 2-oxoglutarate reductase
VTEQAAGQQLVVAVSVSTFGAADGEPRDRLVASGAKLVENPHGRTLTEDEALELVQDADALIAGTEPLTAAVLEGAPRLRAVSRVGIGTDNVDLKAAARLGIAVFNTPDAVTEAAAEITVGGILSVLRHLHWMDAELRAGRWSRQMGSLLNEKTVGVVGLGRVGKRVASLLRPFEVELLGYDIFPDAVAAQRCGITLTPFDELLAAADVLTIHTSKSPDIGPIIGAGELATMKEGAILVDTARGGLIDEDALAEALESGRLGGAYLDVFADEPYTGRLRSLPTVLLTPHAGSYAREARTRMEAEAVEHVLSFFAGGGP